MDSLSILLIVLILIGSLAGIAFTAKQIIDSKNDKRDIIDTLTRTSENQKSQLELLKIENEQLHKSLEIKSDKIDTQNQDIQNLNKIILEKSDFIQNNLFGKGYSYIDIVSEIMEGADPKTDATIYFRVNNDFEFPLYNVSIEVFDFDQLLKLSKPLKGELRQINLPDYKKCFVIDQRYPEINPKQRTTIGSPLNYLTVRRYYLTMSHRNGTYWQRILLVLDKGKISVLTEVFDFNNNLLKSEYNCDPAKRDKLIEELAQINGKNVKLMTW